MAVSTAKHFHYLEANTTIVRVSPVSYSLIYKGNDNLATSCLVHVIEGIIINEFIQQGYLEVPL